MGERLQITLAADLGSLDQFRAFIDRACRAAGVEKDIGHDIKLAVDEACTNIIQHGYAGLEPGSIILSMQYGTRQMVVRLTDFGRPFEPTEPPEPDATDVREQGAPGGFGLFFIYRSMDSVAYDATVHGNTLTMIKRLASQAKSKATRHGQG